MKTRLIAALLVLVTLGACTTDGRVDWKEVGEDALVGAAVVLLVGVAVVTAGAAIPSNPTIVTTCNSFGHSTTCFTN